MNNQKDTQYEFTLPVYLTRNNTFHYRSLWFYKKLITIFRTITESINKQRHIEWVSAANKLVEIKRELVFWPLLPRISRKTEAVHTEEFMQLNYYFMYNYK